MRYKFIMLPITVDGLSTIPIPKYLFHSPIPYCYYLFQWMAGCSPFGSFFPSRSLIPTRDVELLEKASPSHLGENTGHAKSSMKRRELIISREVPNKQTHYTFQPLAPPLCLDIAILMWEATINHRPLCQSQTCVTVKLRFSSKNLPPQALSNC